MKVKVYSVVAIWEGCLENVKVFFSKPEAQTYQAAQLKAFDVKADKWDDEDPENMDYSVTLQEHDLDAVLTLT